jgi:hypothetical protein
MRHWHRPTGLIQQLSAVHQNQHAVALDAGGLGYMGKADGFA